MASRALDEVLGIDVDGTLYDTWSLADSYVEELTGEPVGVWNAYDYLREKYGDELAGEAFAYAVDPSRIDERVLYPGVRAALRFLKGMGVNLVFITTNHDPSNMSGPLLDWLQKNFGQDIGLAVLPPADKKLSVLEAFGAFGMIDDKPDFIVDVADNGMLALAKRHTYNVDVLEDHPSVHLYDWWSEVPDIVIRELDKRKVR